MIFLREHVYQEILIDQLFTMSNQGSYTDKLFKISATNSTLKRNGEGGGIFQ